MKLIRTYTSLMCSRQYSSKTTRDIKKLNFLSGKRCDGHGPLFEIIAPASGELLANIASSNSNDVMNAVKSAESALPYWSQLSPMERSNILLKATELIRKYRQDIADTEVLDTGKPVYEALLDVDLCADSLMYYAGLCPSITGEHIQLPNNSWAYTRREPLGVCGAIGAWNYPFQMAVWKSGPALACGNTSVFKPSPLTPLSAVLLGEIYAEAGLPNGCYNVIQGGTETGVILCDHPDVAKISFTGSVPTGSKIMAACAKDIKAVTLELGGKSPLIIFEDCDLDNAVKGTMLANFLTQGQVCSNATRVFVHESIKEKFLRKLTDRMKTTLHIGDPTSDKTTVGAMISREHGEKVLTYIELAREEGCEVFGGKRVNLPGKLSGGLYIEPCVLTRCSDTMRVVTEEIFGPVACVMDFKTEAEAIHRANNSEFGLAGGVFTKDIQRAHRIAAKLQVGAVYINNYNVYPPELPFGGYKRSGLGRENGKAVFEHYTQLKSVYVEMGDVESII